MALAWTLSNTCFLGPVHNQTASRSVEPFLHNSRHKFMYILQWAFPLTIALAHGGSRSPSNTCFPGSTSLTIPNDMSIGSPVFAQLTTVTDRPTDRPTDRHTDRHTQTRVNNIHFASSTTHAICINEGWRHFFSIRVINRWNRLDQQTVGASSLNVFTRTHQEMR